MKRSNAIRLSSFLIQTKQTKGQLGDRGALSSLLISIMPEIDD